MTLRQQLAEGDVFQGYAYAYPHKTSYRPLAPPVPLHEAWEHEEKDALFLYVHVPFCEMRCGFCNLFTSTHPGTGLIAGYLNALERQAAVVSAALGKGARFARVAIGGGTPTFLEPAELDRLFQILHGNFALNGDAPIAIELSPKTALGERLAVLRQWGVWRVSLGVQSFVESETRALGRAQQAGEVRAALRRLRDAGFPVLNVDLIYGVQGQTLESWRSSLDAALEFLPEEIYLYPLYVRPLTGLGVHGKAPSDSRLALYRVGRDALLARGYRQISMRLFRASHCGAPGGPEYCCQDDGLIGIGAGARSYTTALHYSSEWAVGREGVRAITDDYVARTAGQFSVADYGCTLDAAEQRRRFVIKSLLRADGLNAAHYSARFGTALADDFPVLAELEELAAARWQNGSLTLTEQGMEWSDAIGPWLFSPVMRERMDDFALV
jgi:coproporphyrinogen III oxidase-like Fe-S oxidoreductase